MCRVIKYVATYWKWKKEITFDENGTLTKNNQNRSKASIQTNITANIYEATEDCLDIKKREIVEKSIIEQGAHINKKKPIEKSYQLPLKIDCVNLNL